MLIYLLILILNSLYSATWKFDSGADFSIKLQGTTNYVEGWTDDMLLVKSYSAQIPRLVYNDYGLHIIWRDHRDNDFELYYKKSTDKGRTWSADKRLTYSLTYDPLGTCWYLYDLITASNVIHTVYTDNPDGNFEIYYKKTEDGGETWSQEKRLTFTNSETMCPSIASDGNTLYVVFVDSPTGGYKLYMTTST